MTPAGVLTALLAVLTVSFCNADEDFGFDLSDDLEVEFAPSITGTHVSDTPNVIAFVGKVFHFAIAKDPNEKGKTSFQAKVNNDKPLPPWLLFDKTDGIFWGVPLEGDAAILNISVKSIGQSNSKHDFTVTVTDQTREGDSNLRSCPADEETTILALLIDKDVKVIKPKQRIIAINNVAKFFGLPYSAFKLTAEKEKDDITDSSVILAGPGNLQTRSSKQLSLIEVTVGCDGRLWLDTAPLVHQLKQQARDGTISEVLQLPLIGWRVKSNTEPIFRNKRQAVDDYGSGDYEYYDEEYSEDYDEDAIGENTPKTTPSTTTPTTTTLRPPVISELPTSVASDVHPHRHHHGELKPVIEDFKPAVTDPIVPQESSSTRTTLITLESAPSVSVNAANGTEVEKVTDKITVEERLATSPITSIDEPQTTTQKFMVQPPDKTLDYGDNYDEEEYDEDDDEESETSVPIVTTGKQTLFKDIIEIDTEPDIVEVTTKESSTPLTTEESVSQESVTQTVQEKPTSVEEIDIVTVTTESATSTATTPSTTTTTTTTPTIPTILVTEEEETTYKQTTLRHVSSTPKTTTSMEYTESIEYEVKNFPPTIQNRLKRTPVTAGKMFTYIIPNDTFTDMEDGSNLTLEFLDSEGQPIKKDSWCQFNARKREIYGLPLDEDVSRWEYIIKATDKEGASTSDRLEILVQQHKARRVVNHEFTLHLRIEKRQEFPHNVDWPLKVLRDLSRLYHSNVSQITVRSVNYTSDPVVFTWTNDSLPTNYCPSAEITELYQKITANDRGDPSFALNLALGPELRVKRVIRQDLGVCEPQPKPPVTPPTNFSPILRNPVDHINATVGELLVYQVPDDTFYDPEDVDPRMLNISLLTTSRQPIPPENWLQFDSKNREFYGIPRKAGRSEYHLECRDSGGLTATDSLTLVVHPAPRIPYNVEVRMRIETPYSEFVNSASMQRKFVENLQKLFGDKNNSLIHIGRIDDDQKATIVTWYNKSLSSGFCPHKEIEHLKSILRHTEHDKVVSRVHQRVHMLMGPELPVAAIQIIPQHRCEEKPKQHVPVQEKIPPTREESATQPNSEEYFITIVVPAVIISIMLFIAGTAACVLYRRRRTGKMNVEEDGRSSYGNKGIPVIFQEELDEKPESGTKTPVILKDEKPPLAPPEYSKSGSLKLTDDSEPYQPPPPFTRTQDNGRQPRPKPTPTYRKPPPYVPP